MALTGVGALVGSSAYVLDHLGFQQLLEHPLDDLVQEVRIIQQDPLHRLCIRPTMIVGHRHSVSEIG
jgi:hypothetical protein